MEWKDAKQILEQNILGDIEYFRKTATQIALAEIDRQAEHITLMKNRIDAQSREKHLLRERINQLEAQLATREPKRVETLESSCAILSDHTHLGRVDWRPYPPGRDQQLYANTPGGPCLDRFTAIAVAEKYLRDNPPPAESEDKLNDISKCNHDKFLVGAIGSRLEDTGQFMLEVSVVCGECGMPFEFLGLKCGLDLDGAAASADGLKARLAIIPSSEEERAVPGEVTGYAIHETRRSTPENS